MAPPYEELRRAFRWEIPERFNIGVACADVHPPSHPALLEVASDGVRRRFSFGDLAMLSDRLANAFQGLGVARGDRVAIVLPQRPETAITHLATYKLGAIAVPLSALFGPDALTYRIGDCEPRVVVTDGAHAERVREAAGDLSPTIVSVDPPAAGERGFDDLIRDARASFTPADTAADDPALIIYTSGTTGPPKGAVHAHRVLLGHQPGFRLSHDGFPREGDLFWTPADWAWIGGLINGLLSAWYHGRPVVSAAREGFDPDWALALIADLGVRNAFLPPTALKLMRRSPSTARVSLRSAASGGEPVGEQVLHWAREHLGVTVNEMYGQTEANYLIGNGAPTWPVRPGSMGRPYPGHELGVLDADGHGAAAGETGEICLRVPDPVMFLEYWRRPEATREKLTADGEWLRTGDLATVDDDGYLWFSSRNDDVINSAGYRIGPSEIEACLMGHPAVALAAVIGVPDPVRGEVVKAFVQLSPGREPSAGLEEEIRTLVRSRLAAYSYPRHIEFVDRLPLTTTGKIRRVDLRSRHSGSDQHPRRDP